MVHGISFGFMLVNRYARFVIVALDRIVASCVDFQGLGEDGVAEPGGEDEHKNEFGQPAG